MSSLLPVVPPAERCAASLDSAEMENGDRETKPDLAGAGDGGRRLLIDAMNVIGSKPDKWWNHPDRAMREFTRAIDRYAALTEGDIMVVFDKDPGNLPDPERVEVVIAAWKGRNAADHEIVRIVSEADDPSDLRVVTSDKRLREQVSELGAGVIPAGAFRARMERVIG